MEVLVSVLGLDSISEDVSFEKRLITEQIPVALEVVGEEMANDLLDSIHDIWYLGYTPKQYRRRTDDPSLGTPLGDEDNLSRKVHGLSLDFDFSPTGKHRNELWSVRHGDELIRWIQDGQDEVPPRPFWNDFLEKQQNGGIINAFIFGMGVRNPVIAEGGEKDVVFDGSEDV